MKKILLGAVLFFLGCSSMLLAQNIQTPSEFLGYKLGSQFTRHHMVVDYFKHVAEQSELVQLEKYGMTNERRPLMVSYISSKSNLDNLEQIRTDNLKRTGILEGNPSTEIAVVWLSYNVHGNEASSTEAAMLTIYKLISEKTDWLENAVVILDPCINPDGRDRYVNWYNETKSTPNNVNPETSEHNEPWPGGRPNHYLFDLNRDWAWATQVESQQRIKLYNKWMPHIHVDFHEQGVNSPYYFAPAAEPYHEIVTDWQFEMQDLIGKNHARYFDAEGWQYFTKESFDLLYPSYGDTYPMYMGAIGMTYEQAGHGRAGLGISLENRTVLTLWDRLIHHTTTGLSTVETAIDHKNRMLNEFEAYFDNSSLTDKAYVLRGRTERIQNVKELLDKHEITYFTGSGTVKATAYENNKAVSLKLTDKDLVIPTNQPKGKMVKALFEKNAKLSTPLTYDITSWSLPYVYGLEGFVVSSSISNLNTFDDEAPIKLVIPDGKTYAYIHKWGEVEDAKFLGNLLKNKFNVRYSQKDIIIDGIEFERGSLIIMRGENKHIENFDESLVRTTSLLNQELTPVSTGYADKGVDLGSNQVRLISNKKIAVLSGDGTSSLSFGEIWHFFETQINYPLNVINTEQFNSVKLENYDVLILPERFNASKSQLESISNFASQGGTVIAVGSSVKSFAGEEGYELTYKESKKDEDSSEITLIPYADREKEGIKNAITGAIFKSTIDNTHPLGFGYDNHYYSLKRQSDSYEYLKNGINVGYFEADVTNVSGYAGPFALENISNSLLFGMEYKGRGRIIYIIDNPLFRSFWQNGKMLFVNAVFF